MELRGTLASASRTFRFFVICFVLILNVGFFTGFSFVRVTTSLNSEGIEQNYLGNEEDEEAEEMHFKKSEQEILTLIHNHILSLSLIFFALGTLLYMTNVPVRFTSFLMFKYVIMISGVAMVLSLLLMSLLIVRCCAFPKRSKEGS
jgi:hypothetical protein